MSTENGIVKKKEREKKKKTEPPPFLFILHVVLTLSPCYQKKLLRKKPSKPLRKDTHEHHHQIIESFIGILSSKLSIASLICGPA